MDLGSVFSGILGAFGTGYNIYTNKRDFDYQKALQQQMFEREDTAVQRRMADLKAAGINPNLAAGSAASAGSVVARSNTNDINPGAALDYMSAWQQIKGKRIENEYNGYIRDEQAARARMAEFDEAERAYKFAVDNNLAYTTYIDKKGRPHVTLPYQFSRGETLYENNVQAKINENNWIPQAQKNELQRLILQGQSLMTENQRLMLSQQQAQIDAIYKKWQMNQISTNDLVSNYAKMFGLELDAQEIKLQLDKLGWDKDKFTAQMLVALFNGMANDFTDTLK